MDDDLNTPAAWAEIHFLVKETNKLIEKDKLNKEEAKSIIEFFKNINKVFKVFTFESNEKRKNKVKMPEEEIEKLIKKRNKLRKDKKWEEADLIRFKLEEKGISLYDNKNDTTWSYE